MTFQKPEGVCSDGVIWISFTSESLTDTSNPNVRFGLNDTFGRFWGKHVAPSGQISFPVCAQKCITNRALDGVCVFMTDCYYHWYCHYVVALCPWSAVGTQIKKKWNTDWFFHGSIFWLYFVNDSWILVLDLVGFASAGALSFSLVYAF